MHRIEVVAEVAQQRIEKIASVASRESDRVDLLCFGVHELSEQTAVRCGKNRRIGVRVGEKKPFAYVEETTLSVFIAREKPEMETELYEKPEMKIGRATFCLVEGNDASADEIEKRGVGFHLPDQFIEHLGHEQGDGAFAHVESKSSKREGVAHFPHAMHLGVGRFDSFELHDEHGLKEGGFVSFAPCAADALYQVGLTSEQIGQQVDDE